MIAAVVVAIGSTTSGQQQPAGPQTGAPRRLWPQRPGAFRPFPDAAPPEALTPPAAPGDEPEFVPNEVLVQFDADASDDDRTAARQAAAAARGTTLTADGRLERVTTALAVPDAIAILQSLPQVEFAEPNWVVRHYATSNDPYYLNGWLWNMAGARTTPVWPFASRAAEAWEAGLVGSNAVYVAVIDEGIDYTHPDLAPNIWTNPYDPVDGVDNDRNGRIDDVRGWDFVSNDNTIYDGSASSGIDAHGTHVAGTIGARGGNGIGIAGVSWNVTMISGKFLGSSGTGTTANAILALDYITDLKTRHGLNIIATNNSWGGGAASVALNQAIIRGAKQGILFIAAAGNGGWDLVGDDNDTVPNYPSNYSTTVAAGTETAASYEAVIAVASIDSGGAKASSSNYGPTTVDIAAPGVGILSTRPVNGFQTLSGTSMATPHVTGAAVLYKAAYPDASAREIREAILAYGLPTASMAGITTTGRRLNVGEFDRILKLTIGDARRREGQSGTSLVSLNVSLSAPSSSPVTVKYTTADLSATTATTASNPGAITIPSSGAASPYPSTILVPPGTGTVTNVRVTLSGFRHTWPSDVDVLLVGPAGQTTVLMSDVGGSTDVVNLTMAFDDSAPAIPVNAPLTSGTYRPTNSDTFDSFPEPARLGPYGSALAVFNGTSAVGAWSLFVVDDIGGDSGALAGGWSLSLTTTGPADYVPSSGTITIPPGWTTQGIAVPIVGDLTIEPSETFKVSLFDPVGATIDDGDGIATIVNDDYLELSLSGVSIKAAHIVELRAAVAEARAAKGLPAFTFADPSLVVPGTPIRAIHLVELRGALAEAYAAAGVMLPIYTDPEIVSGVTPVRAAHILELRAAVANLP